jgi:hypothetical protein
MESFTCSKEKMPLVHSSNWPGIQQFWLLQKQEEHPGIALFSE